MKRPIVQSPPRDVVRSAPGKETVRKGRIPGDGDGAGTTVMRPHARLVRVEALQIGLHMGEAPLGIA